jgi:E3 ubiquitin-protein ligase UBR4
MAQVSRDLQREIEAIGEDGEGPLACLVCKEGYLSNPTELLAAYCYCKRLPLSEAGGAAPPVTTLTDKVICFPYLSLSPLSFLNVCFCCLTT